jgi:mannitol-specific phosphotransferase system IIBC component
MGASVLRGKVNDAGLNIKVTNAAINDLKDADIVITQNELTDRARAKLPGAQHFSIDNFMDAGFYDELVTRSPRHLSALKRLPRHLPQKMTPLLQKIRWRSVRNIFY